MRVRKVGRPIGDLSKRKTAKEIGDEIAQAMVRNLNHNVLKEDVEQNAEQEKKAKQQK